MKTELNIAIIGGIVTIINGDGIVTIQGEQQ
jgi:hypothetical protein